jgi:hypothetical protein
MWACRGKRHRIIAAVGVEPGASFIELIPYSKIISPQGSILHLPYKISKEAAMKSCGKEPWFNIPSRGGFVSSLPQNGIHPQGGVICLNIRISSGKIL